MSKTPEERAREIIQPRIGELISGPEFGERLIRDIAEALKEAAALPPRPPEEEIEAEATSICGYYGSHFSLGTLWALNRVYGEDK